jgi:hypothetical protein
MYSLSTTRTCNKTINYGGDHKQAAKIAHPHQAPGSSFLIDNNGEIKVIKMTYLQQLQNTRQALRVSVIQIS